MNLKTRFDAIAKRVYQATAAAVAVVPLVVGAFTQDANTTRVVMEWVAGGVAGFDGLLYIAQRYGFLGDVAAIAEPAAAPKAVTKVVDEAKTVADAAATVEKAAK